MARKILEATGEEIVETRTSTRDKRVPPGMIRVKIRGIDGQIRNEEMSLESYQALGPQLRT